MDLAKFNGLMSDEIYFRIYKDIGGDYYSIRGLAFYTACAEGIHNKYLKKILECALSLQDENFEVHCYECYKPKINNNGVFALIGTRL